MFKRTKKDPFASEFDQYLKLPLADKKVDLTEFWKSQSEQFPLMSKMARDVLPVQSASVAIERDFSDAKRVVTPNRASLNYDTIKTSMCLKSWFEMNI